VWDPNKSRAADSAVHEGYTKKHLLDAVRSRIPPAGVSYGDRPTPTPYPELIRYFCTDIGLTSAGTAIAPHRSGRRSADLGRRGAVSARGDPRVQLTTDVGSVGRDEHFDIADTTIFIWTPLGLQRRQNTHPIYSAESSVIDRHADRFVVLIRDLRDMSGLALLPRRE